MVTGSHWPVRTARQDSLVKASIKNKLAQYGAAKDWHAHIAIINDCNVCM